MNSRVDRRIRFGAVVAVVLVVSAVGIGMVGGAGATAETGVVAETVAAETVPAGDSGVPNVASVSSVASVTGTTGPAFGDRVAQTDAKSANETDPHVNPNEYEEDGNLSDVRVWQAQRLADRIQNATDDVDDGEYDAVEGHFDDTYRDHYEEYVIVVRDDGGYDLGGVDADVPAAFDDAATDLEAFATALATYESLLADYERAVERGDEGSAYDVALELDVAAAAVEETGTRLEMQFDAIETVTAADLGDAPAVVNGEAERVADEHAAVREAQFAETPITAEASRSAITPTDTVTFTGSIEMDDNWPDERAAVTIAVNGDPQTVPLVRNPAREGTGISHDGDFSLEYQPDPFQPTADELRLEYEPTPGIGHQAANTTVPVTIDSVEPTLSADGPDAVAFGETVLVSGDLSVDGDPLDGVPVTITLGGEPLDTVETSDGSFAETVTIPAEVPQGEQDLVAAVDLEGSAIGPAEATQSVRVDERGSSLSISAVETEPGGDEVRVEGTLRTDDGNAVGGQPIRIAVDGDPVTEVTTASDGTFAETIAGPDDSANATVTASFDGEGRNLESTRATTAVETTTTGLIDDWSVLAYVAGGSVLLGGVLVGIWRLARYYRAHGRDGTRSGAGPSGAGSGTGTGPSGSGPRVSFDPDHGSFAAGDAATSAGLSGDELPVTIGPSHAHELLKQASNQLSDGHTNEAVQSAYVAARMELQSYLPEGKSLTHWEFAERYDGPHADALAEITEQYERAAFGLERIPHEEASKAVVSARHLVEGMSDDRTPGAGADLDGIVVEE